MADRSKQTKLLMICGPVVQSSTHSTPSLQNLHFAANDICHESMTEWMLVARLRELLYQQSAQSHNSTADHEQLTSPQIIRYTKPWLKFTESWWCSLRHALWVRLANTSPTSSLSSSFVRGLAPQTVIRVAFQYGSNQHNIIIIGKHATKGAAGQHTHYIATCILNQETTKQL